MPEQVATSQNQRSVLRRLLLALGLALAAAALYLPGLGRIKAPIWDEAYYLSTTARYAQGQVHFAAHPPLGTMLIAAGTLGFADHGTVDWSKLGAERAVAPSVIPASFDWQGTRLLPALFGIACIVLFAGLVREVTGSLLAAGLFAVLMLFDTAIAVQVRSAQLDAFQLAFVLAGLWALARSWRSGSTIALFAFAAFITAAALVRANAAVLAVLAAPLVWRAIAARDWNGFWRICLAGLGGGVIVIVLTLTAYFAATPNRPDPNTTMGKMDLPFFSAEHAAAQAQGRLTPARYPAAARDLVAFMQYDMSVLPPGTQGSHPWDWLLARGFIAYRSNADVKPPWSIGLVPNIVVWLISLGGVIASLPPGRWRGQPLRSLLLFGWFATFGSLVVLDGARTLYLYHYFIPLLIGLALAAVEFERLKLGARSALVIVLLAAGYAALRLPFALGLPVS